MILKISRQLSSQSFDFNPFALVVNYAVRNNTQDFSVFELTDAKRSAGAVRMAADFFRKREKLHLGMRALAVCPMCLVCSGRHIIG